MKSASGTLTAGVVFLCLSLSAVSFSSAQERGERGAVGRWWDNISSRWDNDDASPEITAEGPLPDENAPGAPSGQKRDLIGRIEELLEAKPAIIDEVPGLSRKTSIAGSRQYYYKATGSSVPLKLSLCDRGALEELLLQVNALYEKLPQPQAEEKDIDFDSLADEAGLPESEIPRSREEMIGIIKRRLSSFDEILYLVPGLTRKTSASGQEELYYAPEGQVARKLIQLDDKILHDLFVRVNSEATRLNTERIMKQVRQLENLRRINRPPTPPQPPRTPQVNVPRLPPQPPKVPKVNIPKPPPPVNTGGNR